PIGGGFVVPWDQQLELAISVNPQESVAGVHFAMSFLTYDGVHAFTVRTSDTDGAGFSFQAGERRRVFVTIDHRLREGNYGLRLGCYKASANYYYNEDLAQLEVSAISKLGSRYEDKNYGLVTCQSIWKDE